MVTGVTYYPQQPTQPPPSQHMGIAPGHVVAQPSGGPVPTGTQARVTYAVAHQPTADTSVAVAPEPGPSKPSVPVPTGPVHIVPKVEDVKPVFAAVPPVNGTTEARIPPPGPPEAPQEAPTAPLRVGLRPNRSKPAGIRQSARSGK